MPPNRRIRLFLMVVFGSVFFILYLTAGSRRVQQEKFYQQTVEAMDAQAARRHGGGQKLEDEIFQRLKPKNDEAVLVERQKAEALGKQDDPNIMNEKPIAGRKKMPISNDSASDKGSDIGAKDGESKSKTEEEDPELKAEMNSILKRSPVIIFSKTYCPFSRKAKSILLDKYNIVPSPFVVEIDNHPVGAKLQSFLAANTGRSTVPNVLVNGRSIGGGDDMVSLDQSNELANKIKSMAGKRVMEVKIKMEKTL